MKRPPLDEIIFSIEAFITGGALLLFIFSLFIPDRSLISIVSSVLLLLMGTLLLQQKYARLKKALHQKSEHKVAPTDAQADTPESL